MSSTMVISADALGFESLGKVLYEKGWIDFFVHGPQREPLYPFLISWSMRIAGLMNIPYQKVQMVLQFSILFITQIFVLIILGRLGVSRVLRTAVGLYITISPALTNSALSLYSEVLTYPLILGIVASAVYAWRCLGGKSIIRIVGAGVITSFFFISLIFAKVAYYYSFFIFHIPFLLLALVSLVVKQKRKVFWNVVFYFSLTIGLVHFFVISYKLINHRFNGYFEFTDRGAGHFWTGAAERTEPHTGSALLAHLAAVPGEGICKRFFSEDECRKVSFFGSDDLRVAATSNLLSGLPSSIHSRVLMSNGFELISRRPFQYALLYSIEGLRSFFWETSRLGFVDYPGWLGVVYRNNIFNDTLRVVISTLTIFSFFYLVIQLIKKFMIGDNFYRSPNDRDVFSFFTIIMIISHTAIYALANIVTRYCLHIAPLFLICIALTFDSLLSGIQKNS